MVLLSRIEKTTNKNKNSRRLRISTISILICLSIVGCISLTGTATLYLKFWSTTTAVTTTRTTSQNEQGGIVPPPLQQQRQPRLGVQEGSPPVPRDKSLVGVQQALTSKKGRINNTTTRATTDITIIPPSRKTDNNISVALCHKTIFGNVDWNHVVLWATYHHWLGFDRIFIWYIKQRGTFSTTNTATTITNETKPESFENINQEEDVIIINNDDEEYMMIDDGFYMLQHNLSSYVTMIENTKAIRNWNKYGYQKMITMKQSGNQHDDEKQCLQQIATNYDWVLNADTDEFLWFSKHWSVQEFIKQQQQQDGDVATPLTYLSFGKYMYSTKYRVKQENEKQEEQSSNNNDNNNSGKDFWELEQFPFTAQSFCVPSSTKKGKLTRGSPICPLPNGRAKVLVRPLYHNNVAIHGTLPYPLSRERDGAIHFSTDVAHFKEWAGFFAPFSSATKQNENHNKKAARLVEPPHDFLISSDIADNTRQHGFRQLTTSHQSNDNGTYTIRYDNKLHDWLEFLRSRRTS